MTFGAAEGEPFMRIGDSIAANWISQTAPAVVGAYSDQLGRAPLSPSSNETLSGNAGAREPTHW